MAILAWGAKVSPQFREKICAIAVRLSTSPSWLMACMAFETGRTFSPAVKNPGSSATGLIQFMAATARSLGTTTEALAQMTAEEQLDKVYEYFKPFAGRLDSLGDCYMAILWPPAVGKPDDFEVFANASEAYKANAALDIDHDGAVTKKECVAFVERMLTEGLEVGNRAFTDTQSAAPIEDKTYIDLPPVPPKETSMPFPIALIAALGPIISELIPQVAKAFDRKAETPARTQAAAAIVETITKATGSVNVQEAVEKMQADPAVRKVAADAVLTNQTVAGLLEIGGGVEAARKAAADPTAPPFWRQGAFIIALILTPLIYMTVYRVLWGEDYSEQLRTVVVTAILSGLLGALTGYFFGSMYSSTSTGKRATDLEVKA
jgi:hypothetical protein